jgi:hypothetical protein
MLWYINYVMSKQKNVKVKHTVIHPSAEKLGAIVLTALSLLVSFEAIIEHHPKFSHGHSETTRSGSSDMFVRAETKGETSRLPEEFDIGLQTPHIAGL